MDNEMKKRFVLKVICIEESLIYGTTLQSEKDKQRKK
jgi:hypothetical protein